MRRYRPTTYGSGNKRTCTINRNGDLVNSMMLKISDSAGGLVAKTDTADYIDSVSIEIGGTKIDTHTGAWMDINRSLTDRARTEAVTLTSLNGDKDTYIPLRFWFCNNNGLALPLIALQYHDVRVNVELNSTIGALNTIDVELVVGYVYLDSEERKRFAQASHEYLIEQVQITEESDRTKHRLTFNHPCKYLVWHADDTHDGDTFKLELNGHDRFAAQERAYFSNVQVDRHFEGVHNKKTFVYSFALNPTEHQPSGTCNFSRIDNATLVGSNVFTPKIYAVNYNVLRIMSGMGGLAYSN
jgi:hypothetical protein